MRTPPGVSATDFAAAVAEFERAVGKEWVFTSDADVDLYRDAYSPYWGEPEEKIASAAVAPASVEEVQAVVAHREPLQDSAVPDLDRHEPRLRRLGARAFGQRGARPETHEPRARGQRGAGVLRSSSPASATSICTGTCRNKIKLWLDVPDPAGAASWATRSIAARGYTSFQYRNHFEAHCGMEVVLAERRRRAHRHGRDAEREDVAGLQVRASGRAIDGIFTPVELRRRHEDGLLADAGARGVSARHRLRAALRDFVPLVDVMTRLENTKVFHGFPDFGSPLIGSPDLADLHHFYDLRAAAARRGVRRADAARCAAAGLRAVRPQAQARVLEPGSAVLWPRKGHPRAVGARAGAVQEGDSGGDVRAARVVQVSA